jgi:hypothetical protein
MPMINISHLCLSLFIENHKTNSILLKLFFKIFALKYYYLITHFLVIIKYKINISFMYWNIIKISINYGKYIGMPDTVGTSYIYMYRTRNYEIFPICAKDQSQTRWADRIPNQMIRRTYDLHMYFSGSSLKKRRRRNVNDVPKTKKMKE